MIVTFFVMPGGTTTDGMVPLMHPPIAPAAHQGQPTDTGAGLPSAVGARGSEELLTMVTMTLEVVSTSGAAIDPTASTSSESKGVVIGG